MTKLAGSLAVIALLALFLFPTKARAADSYQLYFYSNSTLKTLVGARAVNCPWGSTFGSQTIYYKKFDCLN